MRWETPTVFMPSTLPLVFVSYAEEDSSLARQLAIALKQAGFATWLYQENSLPGGSYLEQIHSAVSQSDVIAVLLSVSSLRSHQVRKELVLGHDLGKPFMPILVGVSHDDVNIQNPEYRVVFAASGSIPASERELPEVILKIVEGLRSMVGTPDKQMRKPTSVEAPPPAYEPKVSDEWHELSRRLENFPPEIVRLRNWLRRRWPTSNVAGSEANLDGSVTGARVRIADELLADLAEVISQESAHKPNEFALIARGGYGRGVLSVGSDIDVTLVHTDAERGVAEQFWGAYGVALANCWNAVRGIRTSPIILTEEDCRQSWERALQNDDPVPLVSFAFSRHVAGREDIHKRLRTLWVTFVGEMSRDLKTRMFAKLKLQLNRSTIATSLQRFNIKADAGGLLEYRLTGFCEQWLDVVCPGGAEPSWSDPTSHHYMLNLREAIFGITRAHVLTDSQFQSVAAVMFPGESSAHQPLFLIEETERHRRRIRSRFEAALQACEAHTK